MKHEECIRPAKVALVGAGCVGSTAAYSMMLEGSASEIVLIDTNLEKAQGEALDLSHGMQFTKSTQILASDSFKDVHGAQVVVVSAGIAQKPGETRSDLLEKNVRIFSEIIPKIAEYNKECILLIVTNPLDVLTTVAWKLSGFSACRVFGTGTMLDTSRLRYLLGQHVGISPKDISAYILGEHGESEFVWWSKAQIGGMPLDTYASITSGFKQEILEKVRKAAYEVINLKGATYYAIGLVISKIVRSLLLDQSRVVPLSSVLHDYNGYSDISMSVPIVMRKSGICSQFPVDLNDEEQKLFQISAEKIANETQQALSLL